MLAFQGLLGHPLKQLATLPSTSHTSLVNAVVTGDVIRAEVLWTLKVVMCHYFFNSCNDISAKIWNNVSWQWYCEDSPVEQPNAHIWHALDLLHISMSSWWIWYDVHTACYSISFDVCINRISQNGANGLHYQILGRQYQQGRCTIPWVWVSRPCHRCRPSDPFQTRDQLTRPQTTTSGVYGWTKC